MDHSSAWTNLSRKMLENKSLVEDCQLVFNNVEEKGQERISTGEVMTELTVRKLRVAMEATGDIVDLQNTSLDHKKS